MDLGLKDKVVLVAASSRGLGYGIAREAARGQGLGAEATELQQLQPQRDIGTLVVDHPARIGDAARMGIAFLSSADQGESEPEGGGESHGARR